MENELDQKQIENPTPEQLMWLKEKLKDQEWRLNHLYKIVDEHAKEVQFKLNWFQTFILRHLWYLNIVLKARQVGISTFAAIFFLDECLFTKNINAAIIADSRDHAKEIFRTKIEFPFVNLPGWLKQVYSVDTETKEMYKFQNGSAIQVATSVRSGTFQRLHISEFGKICAKTPDKAEEIVTGALNTVHPGEIIIIESTAEGAFGHFYDYCMEALAKKLRGDKLSKLDYRFFFFAWWQVPHYRLEGNYTIPQELTDYFNELEVKLDIKIDQAQRTWYMKKIQTQQENMKREFPSYPEEAFEAAIEGAYYGKLILRARETHRVTMVPHDPLLDVDTWWDLGVNDDNVILFTQQHGREIRLIDIYVNSGEGLAHYAQVLRDKQDKDGYRYRSHNAPHDIEVRDYSTGKSRKLTAAKMGIYFRTMPKISIEDGIEAGRNLFSRLYIDETRCQKFIVAATMYRKEWDDKLGVFKSQPVHDEHSHIMDAYRTLAVGHLDVSSHESKQIVRPENDDLPISIMPQQQSSTDAFDPFSPI